MTPLPQISVITPSFNGARTIGETLASVAAQDYADKEHLVIDGGSTDETAAIVRDFPDVQWVSERDEGHYHAMDKGIRRASGEVFAVLNADDVYRPGALAAVGRAFADHPDWDGVFGDIVFVDGEGREIFRREEAMFDAQIVRFGFCMINHQAFFVRRAIYEKLGGYRFREFKNCCDYDFVMRMIAARCRIGHVRAFLINYRYHDFGQSADLRVRANMARESAQIRAEHGVPAGWRGRMLMRYARAKRQFEKLLVLGKCDLQPGNLLLRKHLREKTTFSSNIGVDQL